MRRKTLGKVLRLTTNLRIKIIITLNRLDKEDIGLQSFSGRTFKVVARILVGTQVRVIYVCNAICPIRPCRLEMSPQISILCFAQY